MDTSNRRGLARDFSKSDDSLLMHMSFAATWMAYVSNRYRQLHRRSCSVFCCVMCRPRNEETLGDVKKKNSSAARLARSFYRLRRGGPCAGSFVDKSRPPLHSAPSCAFLRQRPNVLPPVPPKPSEMPGPSCLEYAAWASRKGAYPPRGKNKFIYDLQALALSSP